MGGTEGTNACIGQRARGACGGKGMTVNRRQGRPGTLRSAAGWHGAGAVPPTWAAMWHHARAIRSLCSPLLL